MTWPGTQRETTFRWSPRSVELVVGVAAAAAFVAYALAGGHRLAATVASAGAWVGEKLLEPGTASAAGTGPAAVASGLVTCVLTPEMTEGPYYVPGDKFRRDITEGRPGTPLL